MGQVETSVAQQVDALTRRLDALDASTAGVQRDCHQICQGALEFHRQQDELRLRLEEQLAALCQRTSAFQERQEKLQLQNEEQSAALRTSIRDFSNCLEKSARPAPGKPRK